MMTDFVKGAAAGLAGTAVMVGTITTMRRVLLTSDELSVSQTHPEKIVTRGVALLGYEPISDETRRRIGDTIHFGYGAMAGVVLAMATTSRSTQPIKHGLILGGGLWLFGFNALLPGIKATKGAWTWGGREFVLTIPAHVAYGIGTAATLKLLRSR